jgi:disulfide bond formation protein DsbB
VTETGERGDHDDCSDQQRRSVSRRWLARTRAQGEGGLWLIVGAVVALIASVWSLSLSLVFGLVPCELCWYQRICMYPLGLLLGVGAYEERPAVSRTVLPLALAGEAIAAYHSWLQLSPAGSCSIGGCSSIQYTVFGLSTPNLALVAFSLVITSVLLARR